MEMKMGNDNLSDHFNSIIINPKIRDQSDMENYEDKRFHSMEENVENFLKLPSDFKPTDMDYHQIDDFYLISLCGGNLVIFVFFEPSSGEIQLVQHKYFLVHAEQGVKENLRVIKAGYIFEDGDGKTRSPVFVTAGDLGQIFRLSVNRLKDSFKISKLIDSHFNQINDLCFAPSDLRPEFRNILLSCSNDGSLMIWNLAIAAAIVCIKPSKLPVDDVLAIDWSMSGDQIISSHLDAVRIWPIKDDVLKKIKRSHGIKKGDESFERLEYSTVEVKINNFHDYFIDQIKMISENVIVTKSVDGAIHVWTYEKVDSKDATIIPFNKYQTISSIKSPHDYKHSYFKLAVNFFDNLIVVPGEKKKIKIFCPGSSTNFAFKTFTIPQTKIDDESKGKQEVIKAFVTDQHLDYLFVLMSNGVLGYHAIDELEGDMKNQTEN